MATMPELVAEAVDLMASQQAMSDQGSLDRLAEIVQEAYLLGRKEAMEVEGK